MSPLSRYRWLNRSFSDFFGQQHLKAWLMSVSPEFFLFGKRLITCWWFFKFLSSFLRYWSDDPPLKLTGQWQLKARLMKTTFLCHWSNGYFWKSGGYWQLQAWLIFLSSLFHWLTGYIFIRRWKEDGNMTDTSVSSLLFFELLLLLFVRSKSFGGITHVSFNSLTLFE